ncbi:AfsR/SARP family transcriptional regulator [Nakamurella alba]|nr:BTAD domain-containing putative transcriptional regulator [Nakamurella alba]
MQLVATFGVLGPLDARIDGAAVDLGPPQHRTVLAALLVDAGRVVPTDVILERVWGTEVSDVPASALPGLHAVISRLRGRLGKDLLVTRSPGYRLAVEPTDVDAGRFRADVAEARRLAAQGATRQARSLVVGALELWRSDPYADITADFAVREAERLLEARMSAVEFAVELDLALGLHRALADRLPELVDQHPLREGLRASLMLALYRSGRQAEALSRFEQGRELLAEELGIDPGPDLRALHEAILRQDPELTAADALDDAGAAADAAGTATTASRDAGPIALHNIPAALTPLIGRQDVLLELDAAFAAHRLVTVLGAGGMGKTTVAVEYARRRLTDGVPGDVSGQDPDSNPGREVAGRPSTPADTTADTTAAERTPTPGAAPAAPDGPWLVELAGVRTHDMLISAVRDAMGIASLPDITALTGVLGSRETLLVLDNCEQFTDVVAGVSRELLTRCPGLRILATSRERLGVAGERTVELGPLDAADARSLFLARADAAGVDLSDDPTELAEVGPLCDRLDRLPLAIELAAAQLRVFSTEELAGMLRHRWDVLSGGPSHNLRHASMDAAVAWTFDQLSDDERTAYLALAVLDGPFDLESARAVTGTDGAHLLVRALADKSVITVLPGRPRRYRMLETLRTFAGSRRSDELTSAVRTRVVAWVLALAGDADDELRGPDGRSWMQLLGRNDAAITAAIDWAPDDLTRLQIATGVFWYWYRAGHAAAGLSAFAGIDPEATGAPSRLAIRSAVADALLHYLAGDLAAIAPALQRAGALTAVSDDPAAQAYALCTISYFEASTGAVADALAHAGVAQQIAMAIGSPQRAAEALQSIGTAHLRAGDTDAAAAALDEAIAQADACGYRWCASSARWIRAKAAIAAGDHGPATRALLVVALADCIADADWTSWVVCAVALARVLDGAGDATGAATALGAALRRGEQIGYDPGAMDPIDTGVYLAGLDGHGDPDEWAAGLERGRSVDPARLVDLLDTSSMA